MGAEQCSHLGTRESHGDELRVASRASILRTRGGGFEKDTLLLVHAIGHPDSPYPPIPAQYPSPLHIRKPSVWTYKATTWLRLLGSYGSAGE